MAACSALREPYVSPCIWSKFTSEPTNVLIHSFTHSFLYLLHTYYVNSHVLGAVKKDQEEEVVFA
jgi:hypothetical protein